MSVADTSVVVVGAGVGGLAAALLFSRAGASVTLIERVAEPAEVGAGLLLQPNGMAVLDGLGVLAGVERSGQVQYAGAVRNARGRTLATLSTPDFGPGLDHAVAVRRSVLHSALLDAVRRESAISTRFATRAVEASAAGRVVVDDQGNTSTLTADLIVGADGVGSRIREFGDFGAKVQAGAYRYLRTVVNRVKAGVVLSGEYWTDLGLFGGAAVDAGHLYFYADATAPAVAAAVAGADLAALRATWAAALPLAGDLLDLVERFDDLLVNDVAVVRCRRWWDGRLVLLGDAAHAMAPTAGQGANSALVDAATLVSEMAHRPIPDALRRYDQRRRRPVGAVQRRADRLAALASVRGSARQQLRDITLITLGRIPGAAQRLARSVQQEDPAALRIEVSGLSGLRTDPKN